MVLWTGQPGAQSVQKRTSSMAPDTVCIMERDLDIFRILSNGPAQLEVICFELGKMTKEKVSRTAIKMRLRRLREGGYIESRLYSKRRADNKGGKFALYGLTQSGVDVLCTECGYRQEMIRIAFPSQATLMHELEVRETVKTIKREAALADFNYFIVDEHWLRTDAATIGLKGYIPDLFVRLFFRVPGGKDEAMSFNIEVDNNSIRAARMYRKIKSFQARTLLLCTTNARIDSLMNTFNRILQLEKNKKPPDLPMEKKVLFALQSDFYSARSGGILGTEWRRLDGTTYRIRPLRGRVRLRETAW